MSDATATARLGQPVAGAVEGVDERCRGRHGGETSRVETQSSSESQHRPDTGDGRWPHRGAPKETRPPRRHAKRRARRRWRPPARRRRQARRRSRRRPRHVQRPRPGRSPSAAEACAAAGRARPDRPGRSRAPGGSTIRCRTWAIQPTASGTPDDRHGPRRRASARATATRPAAITAATRNQTGATSRLHAGEAVPSRSVVQRPRSRRMPMVAVEGGCPDETLERRHGRPASAAQR